MNQWYIKIQNKLINKTITIYENGLVYGNIKNQVICQLSSSNLTKLKKLIEENRYMFKKLGYYNEKLNPFILRVNNQSRKHKNIKIVGWSQMKNIFRIILSEDLNTNVFEDFLDKSCI